MSTRVAPFQTKTGGPGDDVFAAVPPLRWWQRKHCLHTLYGVLEKGQKQGQDEVKLMFFDVKNAHLNAECDVEERVERLDESKEFGKSGWEDDNARKLVNDGLQRGRAASTIFRNPKVKCVSLCLTATSRSQPRSRS